MDDVLIIGGSFAGLAAALTLGRARRKVTVLDTGLPRNRYAGHSHGVLGHDHKPPGEILAAARQQLSRYPSIRLLEARATGASGEPDGFSVNTETGDTHSARRLLLSYGVVDAFPAIAGFAECWGKSVIPCPYCDGFEVADQHWGLLYSGPHALHMVSLYADWTNRITVFADGHPLDDAARADLARRNVNLVEGKVIALEHSAGKIAAVVVEGGETVALDVLFAHPRNRPAGELHLDLDLALEQGPLGVALKVDDMRQTSRAGVYAAGDLANPMASVTFAMAHGVMAAIGAQRSMLR